MCFCSGAVATNQGCIHYFFSIGYDIYGLYGISRGTIKYYLLLVMFASKAFLLVLYRYTILHVYICGYPFEDIT
jgi:hypothetical protein